MVLSFSQVFWEAGMGKALIFERDNLESATHVSFWVNILTGLAISVVLFLFSDFFAESLFRDSRVSLVLRVMTLQVILGSMASVHNALLQRELKFNKLFWVRMSTVAAPAVLSLPLALAGWSYWALVAGSIFGQAAQVVVLWIINPWRPKIEFNFPVARRLIRFGGWVTMSGLLAWFYLWMDSMFVGSYLGTHDLGLFRTGNQFVTMIYGLLISPLLPVLYSHLSSIQLETERLKKFYLRIVHIIAFISIPLAFLIYATGEDLALIVFGEKWIGVGFVLSVMALMHGFSAVVGANGEVYRAIGKPQYESAVGLISLAIYLAGYYISIQNGLHVFVWTRLGLAICAMFLHILFGWLAVRLSPWAFAKSTGLATGLGLLIILIGMLVSQGNFAPLVRVVLIGGSSAVIILPLFYALERNGVIKDLMSIVKTKKIV